MDWLLFLLVWLCVPFILCSTVVRNKDCRDLKPTDIGTSERLKKLKACEFNEIGTSGHDVDLDLRLLTPEDMFEIFKDITKLHIQITGNMIPIAIPWNISFANVIDMKSFGAGFTFEIRSNMYLTGLFINNDHPCEKCRVKVVGNPRLSQQSIDELRKWASKDSEIQGVGECIIEAALNSDDNLDVACRVITNDLIIKGTASKPLDLSLAGRNVTELRGCLQIVHTNLYSLDFLNLNKNGYADAKCTTESKIVDNPNLCVYPSVRKMITSHFKNSSRGASKFERNMDDSCHETCDFENLIRNYSYFKNLDIVCKTLSGNVLIKNVRASDSREWVEQLSHVTSIINGSLVIEKNSFKEDLVLLPNLTSVTGVNNAKGPLVLVRDNSNLKNFDLPKLTNLGPTTSSKAFVIRDNGKDSELDSDVEKRFNNSSFGERFNYLRPARPTSPAHSSNDTYTTTFPPPFPDFSMGQIVTFFVTLSIVIAGLIPLWRRQYVDEVRYGFYLPPIPYKLGSISMQKLVIMLQDILPHTPLERQQLLINDLTDELEYQGPPLDKSKPANERVPIENRNKHKSKLDVCEMFGFNKVDYENTHATIIRMKKLLIRKAEYFLICGGFKDPALLMVGLPFSEQKEVFRKSSQPNEPKKGRDGKNGPVTYNAMHIKLTRNEEFNYYLDMFHYEMDMDFEGEFYHKEFIVVQYKGWIYRCAPPGPELMMQLLLFARKAPCTFVVHKQFSMGFSIIALDSVITHILDDSLPGLTVAQIYQLVADSLGKGSNNPNFWLFIQDCVIDWAHHAKAVPADLEESVKDWDHVYGVWLEYINHHPASLYPCPTEMKICPDVLDRMIKRKLLKPRSDKRNDWTDPPVKVQPKPRGDAHGYPGGPNIFKLLPNRLPSEFECPTLEVIQEADKALEKWHQQNPQYRRSLEE